MAKGKKRAHKESRGNRKARALAGKKVRSRKLNIEDTSAFQYVQHVHGSYPSVEQLQLYHELNQEKKPRGGGRKKNVPVFPFPLIEQAMGEDGSHKTEAVARLLHAAYLTVQPVRRYPGYVLKRTNKIGVIKSLGS